MIVRYWRGWTTFENADAYQQLASNEILPSFASRRLPGYRGSHLLRRELGDEIEFAVIMTFESIDAVRAFAGEDYELAYVPTAVREVLQRFDERSIHYEVLLSPTEAS
jgi:antibiotic biosynthesis monooxygenase (ABM) superfamily enzyme